ncbi:MAG: hypothetical protein AAB602_02480 [Patescibacteria group bacterium]
MPLPQKVVEQLGREPPRTPGWSGKLLMFSGTIFFVVLSVYLGLAFGYTPYLKAQIAKINKDIDQFGQQVSSGDQLKLVNFYSQLGNIKSLLASQIIGLRAFDWIEKNTQVNSYIKNLTVNFTVGQMSYNVSTITMDDALQQVSWLENKPEIEKLGIGGISSSGSEWQFSVQLSLDRNYFSRSHRLDKNATTTK